jgi:hypothetical protein
MSDGSPEPHRYNSSVKNGCLEYKSLFFHSIVQQGGLLLDIHG